MSFSLPFTHLAVLQMFLLVDQCPLTCISGSPCQFVPTAHKPGPHQEGFPKHTIAIKSLTSFSIQVTCLLKYILVLLNAIQRYAF